MATLADIIIRPGRPLAFAIRGFPFRLLTVSNRAGKLHFQEFDDSIGLISGDRDEMMRCLTQASGAPPLGMLQTRMLDDETPHRFCTQESSGKTGVYLDVFDGRFHITGGSSIIGTITGNKLADKLELEFDEVAT